MKYNLMDFIVDGNYIIDNKGCRWDLERIEGHFNKVSAKNSKGDWEIVKFETPRRSFYIDEESGKIYKERDCGGADVGRFVASEIYDKNNKLLWRISFNKEKPKELLKLEAIKKRARIIINRCDNKINKFYGFQIKEI